MEKILKGIFLINQSNDSLQDFILREPSAVLKTGKAS